MERGEQGRRRLAPGGRAEPRGGVWATPTGPASVAEPWGACYGRGAGGGAAPRERECERVCSGVPERVCAIDRVRVCGEKGGERPRRC